MRRARAPRRPDSRPRRLRRRPRRDANSKVDVLGIGVVGTGGSVDRRQVGNQRMVHPSRRAAVEILNSGPLGPAIAAHAWTGSPNPSACFNHERTRSEPGTCPEHIDYDL